MMWILIAAVAGLIVGVIVGAAYATGGDYAVQNGNIVINTHIDTGISTQTESPETALREWIRGNGIDTDDVDAISTRFQREVQRRFEKNAKEMTHEQK